MSAKPSTIEDAVAEELTAGSPEAVFHPVDEANAGEMASTSGNDSLGDMMSSNFLEYASYVIKERAIPDLADGM